MAKTYNIDTPAGTAIANGKSMLAIANTDASKIVKIYRVWVYPNATIVTGVMVTFRCREFTMLTGGTAVTPVAHDSANTSVDLTNITTVTNATITSPSVLFSWMVSSEEVTVSGATNNHLLSFYPFALALDLTGDSNIDPIILRQNQGFDVLCDSNSTAGNFDVIFEFTVS